MTTKIEWTDEARERFWSCVRRGTADQCWPWLRGVFSTGYGQFRVGKKKVRVHRAAYELTHGPIPDDRIICHICDYKVCCNPAHLFLGTHLDNARDRDRKGRQRCVPPPGRPGELNPSAKLSKEDVAAVRQAQQEGVTQREIAHRFDISQSQVLPDDVPRMSMISREMELARRKKEAT